MIYQHKLLLTQFYLNIAFDFVQNSTGILKNNVPRTVLMFENILIVLFSKSQKNFYIIAYREK